MSSAPRVTSDRANEIIVIVGKKQSGKSTRARRLLETRPRRIVVDAMWEHTDGVIVKTFDDLVAYVRDKRHARYAVILRSLELEQSYQAIALATAGTPEEPPLPGVTYLLDEVDRLAVPSSVPEPIFRLANYGRHYGASAIVTARRPQRIPRDFTANADRILIGRVQEPSDLDYLREYVAADVLEQAASLEPGNFLEWEG